MGGNKKVVLFGRTGDGKSTIANALVTGDVEDVVFQSGESAFGLTSQVRRASGRGWEVTNTVGLGEAQTGTISIAEDEKLLTEFLKNFRDDYCHIIFVQRANRVTVLDELIWMLFTNIFQGAEDAFVVLFTGADESWLDENRGKLPRYMRGKTMLTVDMPPFSDRPATERRHRQTRERSMQNFEADLVQVLERRGRMAIEPKIADMDDAQLRKKTSHLMLCIVDSIRLTFDREMWLPVAAQLSSVIQVAAIVMSIICVTTGYGDSFGY